MPKGKILVADDDKNVVFALRRTFEEDGFDVISAADGFEALEKLQTEEPDLVFMDVTMPKMSGLEALQKIKEMGSDVPVVVITGYGTMRTAIQAVQLGAYEYITKPLDVDKVQVVAQRALEMMRLHHEVKHLRSKLDAPIHDYEFVGNDPKIQEIFKTIGAVTATPNSTNVLILGESGTGKELVARAIHESGSHSQAPFVAINCTVLPDNLLESELFGHEKGAFTGATERKLGKFEVAKDGTLFLDEIGDMSPMLQQKLLRVLQEREFERLGGHELIPVKARFIAASNRDLEAEIEAGNFRQDLFFRLNVITIRIPPLRERKQDIPLLVNHFLAKYCQRLGKHIKVVAPEVMSALMAYDYPGNVRELENLIERAVAIEKGEVLLPTALPDGFLANPAPADADIPIHSTNLREARRSVLAAFEKKFICERLKAHRGNVTAAAREAGIERRSFQRMMKKYGIRSEAFRHDSNETG
jgi:DNA-binding NtrC family response regulator